MINESEINERESKIWGEWGFENYIFGKFYVVFC